MPQDLFGHEDTTQLVRDLTARRRSRGGDPQTSREAEKSISLGPLAAATLRAADSTPRTAREIAERAVESSAGQVESHRKRVRELARLGLLVATGQPRPCGHTGKRAETYRAAR